MKSHTDDEWTILNSPSSPNINTDGIIPGTPVMAEHTININAPLNEECKDECTCDDPPVLVRKDSAESISEDYRRSRHVDQFPPPRHYPPSPRRHHRASNPSYLGGRHVESAAQLLEELGKEDGIVTLPFPVSGSVYLSTYPFGDKDVKKWAWLLAASVEDEYLAETPGGIGLKGNPLPAIELVRLRRNDLPVFDPGNIDLPSIYLSRALNPKVVPEETTQKVRYLIVVQNRHWPAGSKLLEAESRKAAGITIFYEALRGGSIVFVGATIQHCKTVAPNRFRKVDSLEEAVRIQHQGYVGVVC